MAAPWEKYKSSATTATQGESRPWEQFKKTEANLPVEDKTMPLESAGRGFAQGVSMGFADEATGAAEALWEKAKGNEVEFAKLYKQYRDESRSNYDRAEKDNPGYYAAGEVGGGIATAVVPIGTTATLGKALVTGARLGAVNALGQSKADNVADMVTDTAVGAGMGAVGAGVAKGVEKGATFVGNTARSLSNKGAQEATEEAAKVASKETGAMVIEDPNVFKEAATSAKQRMKSFWNPDVDPTFEEFANIARKNGIDPNDLPESVKFGPDSSASRAARNLAEGRFGEETLKRFNGTLDKVRDAYDNKIMSYSKGAPVDEVTAGKILRDSYDEGVNNFFDQMDFTHNSVMEMAPGMTVTPAAQGKIDIALNGIEKFAKGRVLRGVTESQKQQGQQLLNAIDSIRAGNGSYKQTVEALRDIGEAAFQSKNSLADVPVDTAKMRKIYNDLNEGLIDTVRSRLGNDIADSLVANNKAMSEFFGDKSLVSRIMGDKAIAPETAFKSLILNGDSQKIAALKKVLPPEKFEYLKGAVLENLVKRDPEGAFTFKQLHNSMRSKKSGLSAIFEPDELMENAGLVRLGDRFGSPVLSSSGTGASLSFKNLTEGVGNLSVDALALRNANKAASKAAEPTAEAAVKAARDVSPTLKELPSKAASALLASPVSKPNDVSSEPKKGPERWVNDGASKLNEAGFSQQDIESLKSTKQGRDLLIEASDASLNSKRMESILKRARSASRGGE